MVSPEKFAEFESYLEEHLEQLPSQTGPLALSMGQGCFVSLLMGTCL